MKDLGRILGAPEWNTPIVIKPDAVYVNTNIVRKDMEDGAEFYEFDCVQYTIEEYLELKDKALANAESGLTNAELAIVELYEMMIGG